MFAHHRLDELGIADRALNKDKARVIIKLNKIGTIACVGERVQGDDVVILRRLESVVDIVRTYEPGRASYQNIHDTMVVLSVPRGQPLCVRERCVIPPSS